MEFIGSQIKIVQYKEEYRAQLEAFELTERQKIYSSLPMEVLDEGLLDPNRRPCIVLNHDDQVVGFFVLHQHYQHEGYDTPINAVYVRSLSINNKLQGRGYGTEIMMNIPEFAQSVFPNFDHLFLVVDAENQGAWNLYERAGFMHLATNPNGPIGKERLYYLDLDAKYVSKLRLVQHDDEVLLMKDDKQVGTVDLEVTGERAVIKGMDIAEDGTTIRENTLRQIATYVRKHYADVIKIEVQVSDALKDVYLNNNFVAMDATRPNDLTKLIRY